MRMDQYFGLNERGEKFLDEHKVQYSQEVITFWEDPEDPQSKPIRQNSEGTAFHPNRHYAHKTIEGAWDDVVGELYCFQLRTGEWVREEVQEIIWSSGPMYFTALKDSTGHWIDETLWTSDDPETEGQMTSVGIEEVTETTGEENLSEQ